MKKGIYLQATVGTGGEDAAAVQSAVQQALAGSHEGLTVQVKRVTPAGGHKAEVILYIEGEQPAPEDFEALTTGVVRQVWNSSTTERALGPALSLQHLTEKDDYEDEGDDSGDLVLPPQSAAEGSGAVAKEPATPQPVAPEGTGATAKEPAAPREAAAPEAAASSGAAEQAPLLPAHAKADSGSSSAAVPAEPAPPTPAPHQTESTAPAETAAAPPPAEAGTASSRPPARAAARPEGPPKAPETPATSSGEPPAPPAATGATPPEPPAAPLSRRAGKRRAKRKGHSHR